ncbi:leucine-rich repeat domain-containing protein [Paenibacillus sp. WQ 127069]|uniref:Leucine-rich repeat domain-containing protein n=1 Tax=Paenibacillus baimaensis TaxID=2982185 RepID=A0ABT2UE06_9BACL|nr:leucine-rich repeat domain-containing protein [Paenibacillus sp. WQ 127069]MCU6792835.1 leucine-rich repeat domain-containing protein [Paenibacillus sp. WQ 127069]
MNITHDFIDEQFRTFLLKTYCDGRDSIQTSDVEGIGELQISHKDISSLNGLEHFTSLDVLNCAYNKLTELDIRRNTRLVDLECDGNELNALNTSHNSALKRLHCNSNAILALDLSANAALESLDCGYNRIRNLDVSQNHMLTELICYWNILSKLELERNPLLRHLQCGYNALFTLELDHHTMLEKLDCGSNHLIQLRVTNCENLLELRCNGNHLTELDISSSPRLESLRCFQNHLSKLQLNHPELVEVYCSDNKIVVLDTSKAPKLERLDYANNLIREPDHTVKGVGTFTYDMSVSDYKVTLPFHGTDIHVIAAVRTKAEMKRLSPVMKKVWDNMATMHDQALTLIANTHPDEDVSTLVLSELVFEELGPIRLGYDAGETPAGQLLIYAVFQKTFQLDDTLVYETY